MKFFCTKELQYAALFFIQCLRSSKRQRATVFELRIYLLFVIPFFIVSNAYTAFICAKTTVTQLIQSEAPKSSMVIEDSCVRQKHYFLTQQ